MQKKIAASSLSILCQGFIVEDIFHVGFLAVFHYKIFNSWTVPQFEDRLFFFHTTDLISFALSEQLHDKKKYVDFLIQFRYISNT